jgi:hypothetical protein
MEVYRMGNKDLIVKENGFLSAKSFNSGNDLLEELEGLKASFERVKIPAGGGLMFEVTGDNGEIQAVKEIEGVMLYHHPVNSYYREMYTGGNCPPDCGSYDGETGKGNPGGSCQGCPYNKFGSGENGKSKACKNRRRIYILREGEIFPVMLSLPTGSLKEFAGYINRLLRKGKKPSSVVTRISLKRAVSSTGIQFSQAVFTAVRDLTEEEVSAITPIMEHVKENAGSIGLDV